MSESFWGVPPHDSKEVATRMEGVPPRRDSPVGQNLRKAPTLKVCALLFTPFCASALMSLNSASSIRLSVMLWYTPSVYLLFFLTSVGFTSPPARSRLLSP